MNNFDLNSIHHLLSFADMCTTNNEYMTEASSLPRIELDTTPLYVIGSVLVVGAAVLLIVKKRMGAEK